MELLNAAVFENGKRILRNVDVKWDESTISIYSRSANRPLVQEYSIEELASERSDSMAWDILDGTGSLVRIVAQTGCGCSGIKPYEVSDSYTGPIK